MKAHINWWTAAGLSDAGAVMAQAASQRDVRRPGIDRSCRVSGQRLDALVAKAYPLFNKPVILPPFDTKTDGARFDVGVNEVEHEGVNVSVEDNPNQLSFLVDRGTSGVAANDVRRGNEIKRRVQMKA